MRAGDLDDERTVYWASHRGKVHLHPDCRSLRDADVMSGHAGLRMHDKPVCQYCNGYRPSNVEQRHSARRLAKMTPEDLGL